MIVGAALAFDVCDTSDGRLASAGRWALDAELLDRRPLGTGFGKASRRTSERPSVVSRDAVGIGGGRGQDSVWTPARELTEFFRRVKVAGLLLFALDALFAAFDATGARSRIGAC